MLNVRVDGLPSVGIKLLCRHLTIITTLLLATTLSLHAQVIQPSDSVPLPTPGKVLRGDGLDIVSLGLGVVTSPGGGSFFEEYKRIGGDDIGFDAYALPEIALRIWMVDGLRLVFRSAYARVDALDIYSVIDSTAPIIDGSAGYSAFVERFSFGAVPVTIGMEYSAVRDQFTTYIGIEGGLSINSADWTTTTQSRSGGLLSRPEINSNDIGIGPSGRVYAGIDYRFDGVIRNSGALRGIFLEGSYLVLPVARDYFTAIRRQGRGIESLPAQDNATLDLGGPVLTIGVNLQFQRR